MPAIPYLAQISLYWFLLYACYWLLLRRHTFFAWNRAYLLASLLGAFLLPLVEYPQAAPPLVYSAPVWTENELVEWEPATAVAEPAESSPEPFPWMALLALGYAFGGVVMAVRLWRQLRQILAFTQKQTCLDVDGYRLILMDDDRMGSFSFLNHIVLNRTDYAQHFDTILAHELVHVRQRHSWDILLVEVLRVLFWFNPVLLLYKRSLQQVHEYLADREVCRYDAPRDRYAEFMLAYALRGPAEPLVNSFFKSSLLKDRIMMLYKTKNSNWSLGRYGVVALLIGVVALLVASCEKKTDSAAMTFSDTLDTREIEAMKVEDEFKLIPNYVEDSVYTVVDENPVFPGGVKALYRFIEENIEYPAAARRANVEGKVFLTFVVNADGSIQDIKVLKGIGFGCDEEAIRVMKQTPRWKPGENDGQKVNVKYNLPISFELPEDSRSSASLRESKNSLSDAPQTYANAQVDSLIGLKFWKPDNKDINNLLVISEGMGDKIGLRGSLTDPNAPLMVIDGLPQNTDFTDNMFKSILKDIRQIHIFNGESARRKYGVRAANGVWEITTKQGEKMPLGIKKN